jgi:hypothetical protein
LNSVKLIFVLSNPDLDRYKGAYCTILEKEACADIFGRMDVMADTLPDMARKIIQASKIQV